MSASSFDLKSAFASVKDSYDGTHEESNLTLQRALFQTRVRERRQKLTRWVVLPIAAVLVASTAFASVRGGFVPALKSAIESLHTGERTAPHPPSSPKMSHAAVVAPAPPTPTPTQASAVEPEPAASAVVLPSAPEPAAPTIKKSPPIVHAAASPMMKPSSSARPIDIEPPPPVLAPPAPPPAAPAAAAPAPAATPAGLASDPNAPLYAEAHHLHFVARDPARALAAWDRYLATGASARFAPEARYNRALTLIRLGRRSEAKQELQAFASGKYGNYRRAEAQQLAAALDQAH